MPRRLKMPFGNLVVPRPSPLPVRRLVDGQLEDVRPVIMADRIEIVARADDVAGVDRRGQEAGLALQRPGEYFAERADDHRAAGDKRAVVGPVLDLDMERGGGGLHLTGADHEAAAFM